LTIEKDPVEFKIFFKEQILDTRDFYEYLNLNGGIERMLKLRAIEHLTDKE
jgi:hypothetical protein